LNRQEGRVTAIAYEPFEVPRQSAQPGLAWWVRRVAGPSRTGADWLLLQPDQEPMRLGERSIKDRPPSTSSA
jgi:hypothetical protein